MCSSYCQLGILPADASAVLGHYQYVRYVPILAITLRVIVGGVAWEGLIKAWSRRG